MTPADFRAARKALGLSQAGLAEVLRLSPANGDRTIRLWETDGNSVPGPAQVAVGLLLERKVNGKTGGKTTPQAPDK